MTLLKRPHSSFLSAAGKGAPVLMLYATRTLNEENTNLIATWDWKLGSLGNRPPIATTFGPAEQEIARTLVVDRFQRVCDLFLFEAALSTCNSEVILG